MRLWAVRRAAVADLEVFDPPIGIPPNVRCCCHPTPTGYYDRWLSMQDAAVAVTRFHTSVLPNIGMPT